MKRSALCFALLFLAFVAIAAPAARADATVIRVAIMGSPTWPCGASADWADACALQTALTNAVAPAEIWVMAGDYNPGPTYYSAFNLKNGVALYGGFIGNETSREARNWAGNVTVLQGGGANAHVVSGNGTDATAVLDGFTVTGGNGKLQQTGGGGMINNPGSPTVRNVIFTNNAAGCGGGMFNRNASPTLNNVTFSNNTASGGSTTDGCGTSGSGGGMYNMASSPTLTNVTFTGNSVTNAGGGGMFNSSSSPTLNNVTFTGNSATFWGGGMYNISSTPTLTGVLFDGNSGGSGGGMNNNNSNSILTNVTFNGNLANSSGGGIYNNTSSPTLTNITFHSNTASNLGGGMYNISSSPTLTNATFKGNFSPNAGAGIYNYNSNPIIKNSILWLNTAPANAEIFNEGTSSPTVSYSVVEGGYSGGTSIITADPLLNPLGDYGGGVQTMALLPGSPAIDAAQSGSCPATDARNVPRSAPVCDIGAFESQGFTLSIIGGGSQGALLTKSFPEPLQVGVASSFGEPVTGGLITFSAPTSGASAALSGPNPATINMFVSGPSAQINAVANNQLGSYSVQATTAGALSPVNFTLTNTNAVHVAAGGATSGSCGGDWSHPCELQYALTTAAASGNEIWAKAGTYSPGGSLYDVFNLKNGVALYGGFAGTETSRDARDWGVNVTVLDGGGVNAHVVSGNGFELAGVDSTAVLDGFTVTGGNGDIGGGQHTAGGGMINNPGSPTVTNVIFTNNAAGCGGGMYNHNGSPTLNNVTFTNNTADGGSGIDGCANGGGGIYNQGASPTLNNVTFTGNSTTGVGAGMTNWGSSNPTLTNVTFSTNSAANGGGIYNYSSNPTLTDVTFSTNSAGNGGGGIKNYSSSPTLINATFSNNNAVYGAGMFDDAGSSPTLTNVTFSTNTAASGAGIYNYSSSPTLINVTFAANSASGGAGAMGNQSSSNPTVTNSILWGNTAPSDPQIYTDGSSTVTLRYSVVEGGYPGGTNIITANPLLAPPGDYGGGLQTIALLPGSSAIDAGDPANCPAKDERGVARFGPTCDIGAFESRGFDLSISGGNFQSAPLNATFTEPLKVSVASAFGEPVESGRITFLAAIAPAGASANFAAGTNPATIGPGGAAQTNPVANDKPGSYAVEASAAGVRRPVSFTLTNAKASTTTTLTSSANPSLFGQSVTFTAHINVVAPGTGTPTGSVTFYELQYGSGSAERVELDRVDLEGATSPDAVTEVTRTWTTSTLALGTHHIVAVYNGDASFETSTSAPLDQTVGQTIVENGNLAIQFNNWVGVTHPNADGQAYRTNNVRNATVTYKFTGSSLRWITYKGPDQGKAQVLIDGANKGTFDLYAAAGSEAWGWSPPEFTLTPGSHTFVLKVLGQHGAGSSANNVVFDGLSVDGGPTVQETNLMVGYDTWLGVSDGAASAGGYHDSKKKGAFVKFTFTGSSIQWITEKCSTCGKADIYIDGELVRVVDLYAAATKWQMVVPFVLESGGTHTIMIVVEGKRNRASRGLNVYMDAFRTPVSMP